MVEIVDQRSLPRRFPRLLARALAVQFDLVLVGFRGHADVPLARLLATLRRVPLVFDPLISRYDEKVIDRKLVAKHSALACWYFFSDRLGCRLADRVLLDTDTHIAYFAETFGVPRAKFRRLWIGADDEVIQPQVREPGEVFTVFFYGHFSPIHGVEYILRAAQDLEQRGEPARFLLVGRGQRYAAARALAEELSLKTVTFLDPMPYADLARLMAQSDVCLGVFGTTAKTQRVIPNKVFDALAAGRAVVTGDTPAVREVLVHGEQAWLCPVGNSRALADALVTLRRDADLRAGLARKGYELFRRQFSLAAIAEDLAAIVAELVGGRRLG